MMNTKELYEAAERWLGGDGNTNDAVNVVRAYRDEHRPNDDKTITEEWLLSIGGEITASGTYIALRGETCDLYLLRGNPDVIISQKNASMRAVTVGRDMPRGAFLLLAKGLGIKLKDPA